MDYNLKYLNQLYKEIDNNSYEKLTIMNEIDKRISGIKTNILFHIVPIIYTTIFFSGCSMFLYKIMII